MAEKANDLEDANVTISENYIKSTLGIKIFCKYWKLSRLSDEEIKSVVFICHGLGEHCQDYDFIARTLVEKGLFVFSHDHVGHGKSEGDRVHIDNFVTYIDDLMLHINLIKEKFPNKSFFILGHSMGGAIAIKTCLDHPNIFSGMVLISPAIFLDKNTATPFRIFLGRVASRIYPQFQLAGMKEEMMSRDPEVIRKYKEDPLNWHGGVKSKLAINLLNVIVDIQNNFTKIGWPFLLLHGTDDQLCHLDGSKAMYEKASSIDKRLKIFEGARHQVHKEIDGQAEECLKDIVEWIMTH